MRYEIKKIRGKFLVYATDTNEHTEVDSEHETLNDAERRVKEALGEHSNKSAKGTGDMDTIDYDAEVKKMGWAQDPDGKWIKVPQPGEAAADTAAPTAGPRGSRGGTDRGRVSTPRATSYKTAREVYEGEKGTAQRTSPVRVK